MNRIDIPQRSQWPALLMALPARQVHALVAALSATLLIEELQVCQSGLGLLTLCDSALGEQYFPGEIPLARALVRVRAPDGAWAEGAALILDDRAKLARSIAILDAVLAAGIEGKAQAVLLLAAGAEILEQHHAQRRAMLAATKVNFSLIGNEDNEDADD